jgi:hypothetical protein
MTEQEKKILEMWPKDSEGKYIMIGKKIYWKSEHPLTSSEGAVVSSLSIVNMENYVDEDYGDRIGWYGPHRNLGWDGQGNAEWAENGFTGIPFDFELSVEPLDNPD